jgi:dTDP-L-rhamnose 4-epimerase
MKVLITGGLGFIGRALTRRLLDEGAHELVLLDTLSRQVHGENPDYPDILSRSNVRFVKGSVCDRALVRDLLSGVSAVYHFAAETGTGQSMYEIQRYYETNVTGTAVLLEEMVKSDALRPDTLVLSSSRSVYGEGTYVLSGDQNRADAPRRYPAGRPAADMENGVFEFYENGEPLVPIPTKETDKIDPRSIYAASKYAQEQMCQIACEAMGVRFVALRLQNVYGPGQSLRNPYTGILSIFANTLKQGGNIDIFEDGEESRDFIYIDDVVKAFRRVLDVPTTEENIINVGTGDRYTVSEIVTLLEQKMGLSKRSRISGRFRPGDIRHCFADVSRMHRVLGFEAETSLLDGLSATIDWAISQPAEPDRSEAANRELETLLRKG